MSLSIQEISEKLQRNGKVVVCGVGTFKRVKYRGGKTRIKFIPSKTRKTVEELTRSV